MLVLERRERASRSRDAHQRRAEFREESRVVFAPRRGRDVHREPYLAHLAPGRDRGGRRGRRRGGRGPRRLLEGLLEGRELIRDVSNHARAAGRVDERRERVPGRVGFQRANHRVGGVAVRRLHRVRQKRVVPGKLRDGRRAAAERANRGKRRRVRVRVNLGASHRRFERGKRSHAGDGVHQRRGAPRGVSDVDGDVVVGVTPREGRVDAEIGGERFRARVVVHGPGRHPGEGQRADEDEVRVDERDVGEVRTRDVRHRGEESVAKRVQVARGGNLKRRPHVASSEARVRAHRGDGREGFVGPEPRVRGVGRLLHVDVLPVFVRLGGGDLELDVANERPAVHLGRQAELRLGPAEIRNHAIEKVRVPDTDGVGEPGVVPRELKHGRATARERLRRLELGVGRVLTQIHRRDDASEVALVVHARDDEHHHRSGDVQSLVRKRILRERLVPGVYLVRVPIAHVLPASERSDVSVSRRLLVPEIAAREPTLVGVLLARSFHLRLGHAARETILVRLLRGLGR